MSFPIIDALEIPRKETIKATKARIRELLKPIWKSSEIPRISDIRNYEKSLGQCKSRSDFTLVSDLLKLEESWLELNNNHYFYQSSFYPLCDGHKPKQVTNNPHFIKESSYSSHNYFLEQAVSFLDTDSFYEDIYRYLENDEGSLFSGIESLEVLTFVPDLHYLSSPQWRNYSSSYRIIELFLQLIYVYNIASLCLLNYDTKPQAGKFWQKKNFAFKIIPQTASNPPPTY